MTLLNNEYFENKYYTYNFRLFKLIGIWHYDMSTKQLIYICVLNLIIAVGSFSQIYLLFTSELKVIPIVKLMETTLPSLCFAACYYNILLNATTMKKILYHIKSDWNKLTNKPELIILKTNAIRTRLCTIIITIAFYLYIIFLTLPSIICIVLYNFVTVENETVLILPICLNNFLKDQMNYYFTFLFECAFILIIATIGVAHYSMFVLIVQHACALFNIVASKIENGFKSNFSHSNDRNKFAQEYEWLVDIIEFYDNAIDFVDLMKLYHKIIYPFEVFSSLLFLIINYLYFFQLLSFTINTTEVLQKFNYIIGSMFVIYVYCYLGQKLIDYHNEIFMKLCQIPFYSFSLKTQKMLPFMIMKSLMPCNLSMKGVIVLSNLHFVALMRISFSYAMIVYNSL